MNNDNQILNLTHVLNRKIDTLEFKIHQLSLEVETLRRDIRNEREKNLIKNSEIFQLKDSFDERCSN